MEAFPGVACLHVVVVPGYLRGEWMRENKTWALGNPAWARDVTGQPSGRIKSKAPPMPTR